MEETVMLMTITQRTVENYLNYYENIKKEPKKDRGFQSLYFDRQNSEQCI